MILKVFIYGCLLGCTFLYFVNYTIDIALKVRKECRKKQMDTITIIKCFLTNVKLLIGGLCCYITYYLAYYSPKFTREFS